MLLGNGLIFLFFLWILFFPLFLEGRGKDWVGRPPDPNLSYLGDETSEKVADRQWEIHFDDVHKDTNQRYTLTVYCPGYPRVHGMIVSHHNGLVTAFPDVEVKCPSKELFSPCPRSDHTRTVFHGQLRPSHGFRVQQVLYASKHGHLRMTKPHALSRPRFSVTAEHGWTWHSIPLPFGNKSATFCHDNNPLYDCRAPTGYFTYWLPMKPNWMWDSFEQDKERPPPSWSGVFLCPGVGAGTDGVLDDEKDVSPWLRDAFSVTVFSRYVKPEDVAPCIMVDGLATVMYDGPDPPVYWYT